MENATLSLTKGKITKINFTNRIEFIKEHCYLSDQEIYQEVLLFSKDGNVMFEGEKIQLESVFKDHKKFHDGLYFSISDELDIHAILKKDNKIRSADEIEIILGLITQDEIEEKISYDKNGAPYYNTDFPMDMKFRRIEDEIVEIPLITLEMFERVMDENEDHPKLYDKINDLFNERINSDKIEALGFSYLDKVNVIALYELNGEIYSIFKQFNLI